MLHPDHLLKSLTARQWQDWIEYARVEPVGDERNDYRTAYAAAGLAGCWVEGVKFEDFRVDWLKERRPPLSLDERIKIRVACHNAIVEAKKNG